MQGGEARRIWRWAAAAIVMVALVAVFVTLFGSAARRDAILAARQQAERRAALEAGTLVADVGKFRVLPFVLVKLPDVNAALAERDRGATARLNGTLRALAVQTGATVFYAIDRDGVARSASNAYDADSFVGYNFRFRPYFIQAMRQERSEYFAQGSVTGRAGLFLARRAGPVDRPAGVVIVKIEFQRLEQLWRSTMLTSFVVDREGVIVIGTEPKRLYSTVGALSEGGRAAMARYRQFSNLPLRDSGYRFERDGFARDETGRRFLVVEQRLPVLGWRHLHLEPLKPVLAAADARTRAATFILIVVLLVAGALLFWSSTRRRRIEAARQHLEAEVARRTAELSGAYRRLQEESDERARADARYRAAREELAQANRLGSIGTITTSVAHELNQPLAAIRAAADNALKFLQREQVPPAEENLSLIISLTHRIGTITRELLSFGRRGRSEAIMVGVDEIIDGALLLIGDSFNRAGVRLEVVRASPLPKIKAARIRIEQVLVNLLQNALDAVSGLADGQVRIAIEKGPHDVRIIVSDNGPGVAADMADAIFQPFFTGKADGTGLGLGISREIVQDHGGALTLQTNMEGGATFIIRLPIKGKEPL